MGIKTTSMDEIFSGDKLINKELESPFIPEKKDNFDKKYCEAVESIDIETKIRYEKYKSDFEYDNLFKNFTYYGIITENDENNKENNNNNKENKERSLLSHSSSMKCFDVLRDININKENKDNNTQTNNNIYSNEDSSSINNINNINSKYIFINLEKDDFQFSNKNNNSNINYQDKKNNYRYQRDKITNVVNIKKPIKNYSITMKLAENENSIKNKNKNSNTRTNNDDLLKQSTIRSHYNNYTPDDLSKNDSERENIINIKQNKNCSSKTPVYKTKKNIYLEINRKKPIDINESHNRSIGNSNLDSYKNDFSVFTKNMENLTNNLLNT